MVEGLKIMIFFQKTGLLGFLKVSKQRQKRNMFNKNHLKEEEKNPFFMIYRRK